MGIRTRNEIEVEKYALKVLRRDFDDICYQKSDLDRAKEAMSDSRSV
ncbi:MAG TPA: hypothetical protein VN278_06195 [Methanosarcina sp.]|nr:hypothetical protein [Methanosarcina sp.]